MKLISLPLGTCQATLPSAHVAALAMHLKKTTLVGMHDSVKDDPGNSANNEAWHQAEEYYEVAWH